MCVSGGSMGGIGEASSVGRGGVGEGGKKKVTEELVVAVNWALNIYK